MSTYTPDAWVIVELNTEKYGVIFKVLASWYGGFAGSNSWKLSSGIESLKVEGDMFIMPQSSGSVYECHKNAERMSGIMAATYSSYADKADENGFTIKVIEMTELQGRLNEL